jgi:phage terminase large subunit GpA-like protein
VTRARISSPSEKIDRLWLSWFKGYKPPPRDSLPDWADAERVLAKEAGNVSGDWRTSRVEVARGPMLAVTEPGVHILTAMVCTQVLKTSLIENIVGYHMDRDPCPMLLVQPKDDAAEQFSKERIAPFIKATPVLNKLIGATKTRDSGDTLLYKSFPGGFLAIAGAGSPDNLARRPIRIVLYDETNKYLPIKEGDPIDIGDERLASAVNWLSVRVCSPTTDGRIEASFAESDQRRASVECPHCQHRQFLEFKHVLWERGKDGKTHRTETARIHCEECGAAWSEGQRLKAMATIRWHQTRPFECCDDRQDPLEAYGAAWRAGDEHPVETVWDWWAGPRWAVYRARCSKCGTWAVPNEHAGFQASKLYSPWPRDEPRHVAKKWIAAQGSEAKLQVWWNTQMAQTYRANSGRNVSVDILLTRREVWECEVPDGVAIITIGVDVQDYRVEVEVVGWGRDEESWSIDYEVFDGEFDDSGLQARLDEYLKCLWHRADGRAFKAEAVCIDSGGHHTTAVYDFAKVRLGRFVWAVKGESAQGGQRNPVWPTKRPTSRTKKTFRPVMLGVNAAKDFIRSALAKQAPGPGYMHFKTDRDSGYFAQLTAERIEVREAAGHKYRVWVLPDGKANEALDVRVYAYAALHGLMHMGLQLNRKADQVGATITVISTPPAPIATPAQPAPGPVTIIKAGGNAEPVRKSRASRLAS